MNISRTVWIRVVLAAMVAMAALFFIRLHNASGAGNTSAGYRLAEAWCKECHAINAAPSGARRGPAFTAIANRTATTALSIKVFLKTSHRSMPNLVIAPNQADDLADYILSLKRS